MTTETDFVPNKTELIQSNQRDTAGKKLNVTSEKHYS
jgi:hypothetical protein